METITFYSYKGGVGRTLALANISIYLSRFGQNVCIIDFDLEAPGLQYKFSQLLKDTEIKYGLVDYIHNFTQNKIIPDSLKEFSITLPPLSEKQGEIRLITAGNVLSSSYWQKLASIDWHKLFYEEYSEGVPFFLELKERIKKEFKPDFLLIDSRTGITEMSGLCTSLLPDKVVFLIINNKENVEGARQILRSIKKFERLPEQKPIEAIFALTRIPSPSTISSPKKEKLEELEIEIIKSIKDSLNEPTDDLERQLNIKDIYVLHSERELELSESLSLSQEGITRETPLYRDYLRLFSKIIPRNVIEPKIDDILKGIIDAEKLFGEPDKIQQELEGLVEIYPYPKSFEKLIDFYILRNEKEEKLLDVFHKLWKTFGIDNQKMLLKYTSSFMKGEIVPWRRQKFELEIIEKYLDSNPENKIDIEFQLADAFRKYNKPKNALTYYRRLLDEIEEKREIIMKLLDIFIETKFYKDAEEILIKYSDIIDEDISLRVKKTIFLYQVGKMENVKKMLDDGGATENALFDEDPSLFSIIMKGFGKLNKVDEKLNILLTGASNKGDFDSLFGVGKIFYGLDRKKEFRERIIEERIIGKYGHSKIEKLLQELDIYYKERHIPPPPFSR